MELPAMLHFTCDLCGRKLTDERFVVRVEMAPAHDPDQLDEGHLDADHLSEISESLQAMESTGDFEIDDPSPKSFRFDLCPDCRQKYQQDPLRREPVHRLRYSHN